MLAATVYDANALLPKEGPVAATRSQTRVIDGLQGIAALIGITLGLIPLVWWALDGQHSAIFRWVFGAPSGSMAYVVPLVVIAVVIGFIAVLERLKRRT